MNYLTYDEYVSMGGSLDASAFSAAERKARYLINSQSGGQTGRRIASLAELPQAVKDCVFDLIPLMAENEGKQISSESQSQGGASESYSYVTKTHDDISAECEEIICSSFYGGGIGDLLYRGVDI